MREQANRHSGSIRLLTRCLLTAVRFTWSHRLTIVTIEAMIWGPLYAIVSVLPDRQSALAQLLLESLVEPLWVGSLIHTCRASALGRQIGASGAVRRALRSYPRMFGIRTILELRIVAGVAALIVPGIVLFVRYALMDVLAICEPVGPTQCRTRSRELTAAHFAGILVLVVGYPGAMWVLSKLVDIVVSPVNSAALTAVSQLITVAPTAFFPIALFEYYQRTAGTGLRRNQRAASAEA